MLKIALLNKRTCHLPPKALCWLATRLMEDQINRIDLSWRVSSVDLHSLITHDPKPNFQCLPWPLLVIGQVESCTYQSIVAWTHARMNGCSINECLIDEWTCLSEIGPMSMIVPFNHCIHDKIVVAFCLHPFRWCAWLRRQCSSWPSRFHC